MSEVFIVQKEWYEWDGFYSSHGEDILKVFDTEKKTLDYIVEFCRTAIESANNKQYYINEIPSIERIKETKGVTYYNEDEDKVIGVYYYKLEVE